MVPLVILGDKNSKQFQAIIVLRSEPWIQLQQAIHLCDCLLVLRLRPQNVRSRDIEYGYHLAPILLFIDNPTPA